MFMYCVRNPRNINTFVRVPGREDRRPGENVYVPNVYMPFLAPKILAKIAQHLCAHTFSEGLPSAQISHYLCTSWMPPHTSLAYILSDLVGLPRAEVAQFSQAHGICSKSGIICLCAGKDVSSQRLDLPFFLRYGPPIGGERAMNGCAL